MSGDLISRSALMEEIKSLRVTITGLRAGNGILNEILEQYKASVLRVIDEAPTAYNVDKVVEQLEEDCFSPDNYPGYAVDVELAIKIVKAGGVE